MAMADFRLRRTIRVLFLAVGLALIWTPNQALAADSGKPEEVYLAVTNMNIPVLQNGKSQGTLLFNFLLELTSAEHRSIVSRYSPKIRAEFFDELFKFAADLDVNEEVKLREVKKLLTDVVQKIVGKDKVKAVLVKDYRRAYAR